MIRKMLERLGLVRRSHEITNRYQESDQAIRDGKQAVETSRRFRLQGELDSYRRKPQA